LFPGASGKLAEVKLGQPGVIQHVKAAPQAVLTLDAEIQQFELAPGSSSRHARL
jgi:hypothetical protein